MGVSLVLLPPQSILKHATPFVSSGWIDEKKLFFVLFCFTYVCVLFFGGDYVQCQYLKC